ncbi:MAG: hypothetical protein MJ252_30335, partial [archaeon]|nr:hypothetical protein [archaeon]
DISDFISSSLPQEMIIKEEKITDKFLVLIQILFDEMDINCTGEVSFNQLFEMASFDKDDINYFYKLMNGSEDKVKYSIFSDIIIRIIT